MKKIIGSFLLLVVGMALSSHVGSPNIIFEGSAGEYKLLVNILPPEVVPGTADISVQVLDQDVYGVTVQSVYYRHGGEKSPTSEPLEKVKGEGGYYSGLLWLMAHGSSSVKVTVEGARGTGSTVIPVPALATAQLAMDPSLGIVLIVLATILFVGGATIIGTSVGEGVTPPGEQLPKGKKRKSIIVGIASCFFLAGLLYLGSMWWEAEENSYERYMYRPVGLSTSVEADGLLKLQLDDKGHIDRKPGDLVPDHGKFMHLFMMSQDDADIFAHLHPIRIDSVNFEVQLPDLPAGSYKIFADVVHLSGLSETLLDTVILPTRKAEVRMEMTANPVETPSADADDTWYRFAKPNGNRQNLGDGLSVEWANKNPLVAGQVTSLQFEVSDENGLPVIIQPYLGMLGHSVVLKEDASVFIHLHPIGTISMAAQEALASTISDEITLCTTLEDEAFLAEAETGLLDQSQISTMRTEILKRMKEQGLSHTVSFPYAFPTSGKYRVWIQVKVGGQIRTAAFDMEVA